MADTSNPFFAPSTLPYQLPPFADIRDEHYLPAFERGFEEHLAQIADIADSAEEPTFENTIAAMERAGGTLGRVANVFFNKSSSDSSDFTNELEEQIAPRLAAHEDAIRLNSALYARIKAVHDTRAQAGLDPESVYLVERIFT